MPQSALGAASLNSLDRAEALEHQMSMALDKTVIKSVLFASGEIDPTQFPDLAPAGACRQAPLDGR